MIGIVQEYTNALLWQRKGKWAAQIKIRFTLEPINYDACLSFELVSIETRPLIELTAISVSSNSLRSKPYEATSK